jgi:hypothetical protein
MRGACTLHKGATPSKDSQPLRFARAAHTSTPARVLVARRPEPHQPRLLQLRLLVSSGSGRRRRAAAGLRPHTRAPPPSARGLVAFALAVLTVLRAYV